jgi:MFS family permease
VSQKIFTRDFALSFLAQFSFSIGLCSFIPTLPIYFAKLGAREAEIGVLVGALSVSALVLRPLVGRGLLRVPEKTFMIAGNSIFALASISYLFFKSFWVLIIIRLFQGVGWALFATSSWTLAARIIPEARRGQGLSYFYLSLNTAFALGPSFGMFLVNQFDFVTFFLLCTGLCLGSLYTTFQLRTSQVLPPSDPSGEVQYQAF